MRSTLLLDIANAHKRINFSLVSPWDVAVVAVGLHTSLLDKPRQVSLYLLSTMIGLDMTA